jgi:uncharacterized protein
MDRSLTSYEIRVLGCLMEKEMATPDAYPLSLNALIAACNQKSNRLPVVCYDQACIIEALNGLRDLKLARQSTVSRVPKYEQIFTEQLRLLARESAVLSSLLVRGPQTAGELRSRTDRLYAFTSLDEVQQTLTNLEDAALVTRLPRQPGHKESRYAQVLGDTDDERREALPAAESAALDDTHPQAAIEALQEQVDELRREMTELQRQFAAFKAQFD